MQFLAGFYHYKDKRRIWQTCRHNVWETTVLFNKYPGTVPLESLVMQPNYKYICCIIQKGNKLFKSA